MVMAERLANHERHPPSKLVAILASTRRLSVTTVTWQRGCIYAPARRQVNEKGLLREVHAAEERVEEGLKAENGILKTSWNQ